MYSKEELISKAIPELQDIAKNMGVAISDTPDTEALAYAILDKQAEDEGNKNPLGTKRRRTRIVKKETDKVYTVNGKDGENFDLKKNKPTPKEDPVLFSNENLFAHHEPATKSHDNNDIQAIEDQLAALPKHRGRKTKQELELMSLLERATSSQTQKQISPQPLRPQTKRPTLKQRLRTTLPPQHPLLLLTRQFPRPNLLWAAPPRKPTSRMRT